MPLFGVHSSPVESASLPKIGKERHYALAYDRARAARLFLAYQFPVAIGVHPFARMAKGSVFVTIERCKGCGFCVEFCPTHVLSLSSAFNSKGYHPPHVVAAEKCSGCDLCGLYCPDFAIYGARRAS